MPKSPHFIYLISFFILAGTCSGQAPKLILPVGHTQVVIAAKFSPDGQLAVTASDDGTAKLWDSNTGKMLGTFLGHTGQLTSVNFSPDGSKIVTTSWDQTAKVWAAKDVKLLFTLPKGPTIAMYGCFSPNGKLGASAAGDSIYIWNANSGALVHKMGKHSNLVVDLEFSLDSKQLVSASWDKSARIWDVATGDLLQTFVKGRKWMSKAAFSPDGHNILTMSDDSTLSVWRQGSDQPLFTKTNDQGAFNDVRYSPDGSKIIASGKDAWFYVYEAKSGNLLTLQPCPTDDRPTVAYAKGIKTAFFTPDGKKIIAVSADGASLIYDAFTYKLAAFLHTESSLTTGDISWDGTKVLCSSFDGAYIFSADEGYRLTILHGSSYAIRQAAFSNDGKFVISSQWDTPTIWNTRYAAIEKSLEGHDQIINFSTFSRDDGKVATFSGDGAGKIWDGRSFKLIADMARDTAGDIVDYAEFSKDGKYLLGCYSYKKLVSVWDAVNGNLLGRLSGFHNEVKSAKFNETGTKIVTASDSSILVWDIIAGRTPHRLGKKYSPQYYAEFNSAGNLIATTDQTSTKIWSVDKGLLIDSLPGSVYRAVSTFNRAGSMVLCSWYGARTLVYDIAQKHKYLLDDDGELSFARFSTDGKTVITGKEDHTVTVWDFISQRRLQVFKLGTDEKLIDVNTVSQLALVTDIFKSKLSLYDLTTGKKKYDAISVLDGYLTLTPAGYYMSTPDAAKLLYYVTPELTTVSFDQLDLKYNRPDKVLASINCGDQRVISAAFEAYRKRLEKSGINPGTLTVDYQVPKAEIANRHAIMYDQKTDQLALHIVASDPSQTLDHFNVWVNQVPVFGVKGVALNNLSKHLDREVTIKLSQGDNQIETAVINTNGAESYHEPLNVSYLPEKSDTVRLYFVGIGIGRYADSTRNLSWCAKDIMDLEKKFRAQYGKECVVSMLIDPGVTLGSVRKLKEVLIHTSVNDRVVVAYSGHGLLTQSLQYYLASYNMDFKHPEKNGIPYEILAGLLEDIPARQKLLLIDACNSGEVDQAADRALPAATESIQSQLAEAKKLAASQQSNGGFGDQRPFELMRQLFAPVGNNSGTTIISASTGTQAAGEAGTADAGNGLFTACVLKFLEREHCSIGALKKYVYKNVTSISGGAQVPTTRTETNAIDWDLW